MSVTCATSAAEAGELLRVQSILSFAEAAKSAKSPQEASQLLQMASTKRVPMAREHLSTEALQSDDVWKVLLMTKSLAVTALFRNMGNMAKHGVLADEAAVKVIESVITDPAVLRQGRIHPLTVLVAREVYGKGSGIRGRGKWAVDQRVKDVLSVSFERAFEAAPELDVPIDIAVDVSGSMHSCFLSGTPIKAAQGAAVMAMVAAKKWRGCGIYGFSTSYFSLKDRKSCMSLGLRQAIIRDDMTLESVIHDTGALPFAGTDCSLPMVEALRARRRVQAFIVITDSETGSYGVANPSDALRAYRREMKIPDAMLIVIALTANLVTIADPRDPYMLDIAGFDPGFMQTVETFIRTRGFTKIDGMELDGVEIVDTEMGGITMDVS